MALKLIALGFLHLAAAMPATSLQDLEVADDTASVGSYVREVRAAPPENYHRSYENEGNGDIGYSRKKSGGGKKGYQHFDSFHKKAGDNYEFEKQDSFGDEDEGHDKAHSHRHEQRAERYQEPSSEDEEEHENKEKSHDDHEAIKEDTRDDKGAVEAEGHDPADYTLPEKYTYGTGEEYNF